MDVMPEGQAIRHEIYGAGIVIASDSDRTSIHFETHGRKLFVTGMMKAEIVGGARSDSEQSRSKATELLRRKAEPAARPPRKSRVLTQLDDRRNEVFAEQLYSTFQLF